MLSSSKTLDVPYYTQPTSNTCQSTCLRMFATYLERHVLFQSTQGGTKDILAIWKEINTGSERPVKARNSYENMKWWLEKYFAPFKFEVRSTKSADEAMDKVVQYIDRGFPVMVSTNHNRTDGHIILVIGYSNFVRIRHVCSPEFFGRIRFTCHDPYGKFDPQLGSKLFGKKRWTGGLSLGQGGEVGPGKAVELGINGIRRNRSDRHSASTFYLVSGQI